MSFVEKLGAAWTSQGSMLCVGLDPDIAKFPAELRGRPDAVAEFCIRVVDATAQFACAFKPQIAYFAALRAEEQLEQVCRHVRERHPHLPLILDAKRGDIGATAEQYAREAFERYDADAVTVNPYMGQDSIAPYLEWRDRGVIVLCRTSNPGGSDLQFLNVNGQPLYQHVAELVANKWNTNGQCGLVVGATFPAELAEVRRIVGDMPLLVPGIGAQGGDVEATVRAGMDASGAGMMISSSRAILYARPQADETAWQAVGRAAKETRDAIRAAGLPA
ncbi:orotidine-5'-phosphate decarboxylase [Lacisediminimonas sp.]|uniref:orotidine-5'-phosphate decarboxylase n=1 Tax=Lacisediminimonas sp. TaxID=3060582 RepID=UPI002720330B|nr:orotidine-5'-phosphate decarboxylase [Lacisediminimonas sp.]MDO8299281.1 orotidine-5'-phosphate decarboxylase [Lacisediminimonas sp.]